MDGKDVDLELIYDALTALSNDLKAFRIEMAEFRADMRALRVEICEPAPAAIPDYWSVRMGLKAATRASRGDADHDHHGSVLEHGRHLAELDERLTRLEQQRQP